MTGFFQLGPPSLAPEQGAKAAANPSGAPGPPNPAEKGRGEAGPRGGAKNTLGSFGPTWARKGPGFWTFPGFCFFFFF